MISTYKKNKGFTIIELLIVIVVIGILATIGFVAYGNVTKSARDSDRQADAGNIAKKAEEGYAKDGQYPADVAALVALGGLDGKTTTSPKGGSLTDGGTTGTTCDTSAPTSGSDSTGDFYCYSVTDSGDKMAVGYWSEADGAVVYVTGVNNDNVN